MNREAVDAIDWSMVQNLPTLAGLLPTTTRSLLGPLSRFSLSFFRSHTGIPLLNLLDPLFDLPIEHSDHAAPAAPATAPSPVSIDAIIRALSGLERYATQLRSALLDIRPGAISNPKPRAALVGLCDGYLRGFYHASNVVVSNESSSPPQLDLPQLIERCLSGFFILNEILGDPASPSECTQHLLASPFPAAPRSKANFLTPIFSAPRALVSDIQHHQPTRSDKSTAASQVSTIEDFQRRHALWSRILGMFVEHLGSITELPIRRDVEHEIKRSQAWLRKEKEENVERVLRLKMEALIVLCDMSMSMAATDVQKVKARAAVKYQSLSEATLEEGDVKPGHEEKPVMEAQHWEDMAEKALIELLVLARTRLDEGRGSVLSEPISRSDWLYQDVSVPAAIPPEKDSTIAKVEETGHNSDDEDSLSSTGTTSDEDDEEGSPSSHPCPIRSLFRLQERYEELRLAVWLSLPISSRGKMGAFMRGFDPSDQAIEPVLASPIKGKGKRKAREETAESQVSTDGSRRVRRVGEVWDEFGLRLMMVYDSETPLNFGLGAEKLDNWIELASKKNAKKIRRRGRKTV